MGIRTQAVAAIAAVGVLLGGVVAAGPASASVVPARPVYTTTYTVIDVTSVGNHVDYAHVISRCSAVGGTCSITKGKAATLTVGVALGWSRAGVSPYKSQISCKWRRCRYSLSMIVALAIPPPSHMVWRP